MPIKHMHEYRDPEISRHIVDTIRRTSKKEIRLMEVCGTHTVSIFRSGIRSLLPETITLLSGPGCPVCVTAQGEIDAFIAMAGLKEVILTTFGDLMRVPGSGSSLRNEQAGGCDIRMVYSTFDALKIAREHPDKKIVFAGVGFETTAPTTAASIHAAKETGVHNFFVYSAHKRVPPALHALMANNQARVDGFILPGHVSVITGTEAYRSFFEKYRVTSVIAGFEPVDILQAISILVERIEKGEPDLVNAYPRAVTSGGNSKARGVMEEVFHISDAVWRGIGTIPESGLKIREKYTPLDAEKTLEISVTESEEPKGCACGEILTGIRTPPECPLYRKKCSPMDPVGPCMVSAEGTCAAYYRYHNGGRMAGDR